jgi:putative transposase
VGWVRFRQSRMVQGKLLYLTVSETAAQWFVSFTVECPVPEPLKNTSTVGVDVGIKSTAVLSDGTTFPARKHLASSMWALQRAQKDLSRKQRGSMNRGKAAKLVAKLHAKVARQRRDWHCKIAAHIAKNHGVVVLETLDVDSMKNRLGRGFNRSLADAAMAGLQERIRWAVTRRGGRVKEVSQWIPTSKSCSRCGAKQDMSLAQRTFSCVACGFVGDRDYNAARNIRTAGLAGLACGGLALASPEKQEARGGRSFERSIAAVG